MTLVTKAILLLLEEILEDSNAAPKGDPTLRHVNIRLATAISRQGIASDPFSMLKKSKQSRNTGKTVYMEEEDIKTLLKELKELD